MDDSSCKHGCINNNSLAWHVQIVKNINESVVKVTEKE